MSDVLVVRVNANLRPEVMNNLKEAIEIMKESGTIVLPSYCEALVIPEDCTVRVEDQHGNDIAGRKLCEYYTDGMGQLIDKCRELYEQDGWSSGGYLHILLDDCNYEDDDIKYCIEECKTNHNDPASALGIDICNELLSMGMNNRSVFFWLWTGWDGQCMKSSCDGCEYIRED